MSRVVRLWGPGLLTLVLGVSIALGPGCAAKGKVTVPGGSYEWDKEFATYTVSVPADRCWTVYFKDANGNTVGTPVERQGPYAGHLPEEAVDFEYEERTCPEEGDIGGDPMPGGFDQFKFLSGALEVTPGIDDAVRRIHVLAATQAGARQKADSVVVGDPLPSYTTVEAIIVTDLQADTVTVATSLPSRFDEFELTVDGVVVADLTSGTTVGAVGNGWVTVSATLSTASLVTGAEFVVSQRAAGSSSSVELELDL